MKTNPEIFIDIKTICNFFGKGNCQILPGFHSITGCDTTSFSFKKMCPLYIMHLLEDVGKKT